MLNPLFAWCYVHRRWLSSLVLLATLGVALLPMAVMAQSAPDHGVPEHPGVGSSKMAAPAPSMLAQWDDAVSTGAAPHWRQAKALDAALPQAPVRAISPTVDGFGYSATVIPFSWLDISGTGTPITDWTSKDDGFAGPLPIGFQFPLYGAQWSEFYANSNGYLSFGAGSDAYDNACPLPDVAAPNNIVALLWDDLNLNTSGTVYYQTFADCPLGGGQCLVVAYHNAAHYDGLPGSAGTWQAILYASGQTILQFLAVGAEAGSSSTTGIENANAAADFGLTYACNTTASLSDNLAIRFAQQPGVALTPAILTTEGCNATAQVQPLLATNRTGAAGSFTLAYAATPGVTVQGPGSLVLGLNQTKPVTVTLASHICPAPSDGITATVTITGNGFGAVSVMEKAIVEGALWQELPTEPDLGRMDNVLAAYHNLIWSVTGYSGIGGNANVRTYNPASGAWTTVVDSAPPFGVNYARSGCQHGDKVYVYGDASTAGFTGLWSYNLATNTWAQETPTGTPPPTTGIWAPAWAKDAETNLCYLTGGATEPGEGTLTSVQLFNPVSNAWQTPPPNFTTPRGFHAAFVWRQPVTDRKLLCVLGGTNDAEARLDSTQCYDFGTNTWGAENADLPALPAGWWSMGYAARFHVDTVQLWLVGGSYGFGITDSTFYYDPLMNDWLYGGALATSPAYRTSAVTLNNIIYQMGGATSAFKNTGNANLLGACPYCAGIRLEPQNIDVAGCNNEAQHHRFSLWNDTTHAVTFALRYAATPGVTLNGPATVGPVAASSRSIFNLALTPALCPEADVVVTATVTANGGGHQALAELDKYVASGTDWEEIASEPNDGRADHILAAYAGKLWAIGGSTDGAGDLPVRTYDPATNAWSSVANSVAPWGESRPHSGCQVGSRVYMVGDTVAYHGLVYYDMATNVWQQVTGATNPPALAAIWAPAWVYDPTANICYLTGGGDDGETGLGNLATVYAYNPTTNAWSTLPPFTTPRNWHAAFVTQRPTDNHRLLCIAGGNSVARGLLDSTQCYDFTTGVWNQENADMGPLPEARWGMGYAQRIIGAVTQLWIVAGSNQFGDTDDAIFFDFLRSEWRYDGFLATGYAARGAAALLGDVIYFTGGSVWDDDTEASVTTGAANRTVDCPACVGLFLQPDRVDAAGCAASTQTHTFELWNLTGATGAFAMSFQPGAGVAATGPVSLTTNHGTVTPFDLVVTPLMCPALGTQLNVKLGAMGNGFSDASNLHQTISDAVWVARTPVTSTQYGAAGAVLGNKLYVAGGFSPGYAPPFDHCRVYDAAAAAWTFCPTLGVERLFPSAASDGQTVYVMGGEDDVADALAAVEALAGGDWQTKAPLPAPRTSGAAAGTTGILYYSGGYDLDGAATASFWQYSAASNTWSNLPDLPGPTAEHAMALANGNLYLFPSAATDVWIYNFAAGAWRVHTPHHPAPAVWTPLAVADGDRILRIGGIDYETVTVENSVWAFSLADEDFTPGLPLREARELAVGGVLNGEPYAGLGADWDKGGPRLTLESLRACPACGGRLYLPIVNR